MGTTAYDRLQDKIRETKNLWNNRASYPLSSSYERARDTYLTTLKEQKELDRLNAEKKAQLVMLALSLAGGSVLATFFGKAAAKTVAAEIVSNSALNIVVNKGWERAFSALAWTDKSAGMKFVLGSLWDEVGNRITKEVSDKIKEVPKNITPAKLKGKATIKGPVEYLGELLSLVNRWENAVMATGRWLYDSPGGEAAIKTFQKSSPFFKLPKRKLDVGITANKMELSFWMKYLLDSDFLETGYWKETGRGISMRRVSTGRKPINVNPSNPKYPKAYKQTGSFGGVDYSRVGYDNAGEVIRKRINLLHKKAKGQNFFTEKRVSKQTLQKAQQTLQNLASQNANIVKAQLGKT